MNIAIVFEGDLSSGGGYQQQLSTILELKKNDNYNIIAFTFSKENTTLLDTYGVEAVTVEKNLFDKVLRFIVRQDSFFPFAEKFKIKTLFEIKLDKHMIDLVYFLSPSILSLELLTYNYIITNWDLCHRDTPEFPEINHFRTFELREQLFKKSLTKAVAILVDSTLGKENVMRRYGVDGSRIYVAPFTPSVNVEVKTIVDIKSKYAISTEYIYYPAQFWAHKNHVYIIDAIALLQKQGIKITAIFSGSNKGNLNYILNYSKTLGVNDLVKYIGFAPNEEIYSLYKNALAMVMPSYFGPTNIPPLEAFAIGTPVVYSDRDGLRDQVGEAAMLCDLKNPNCLAEHIKNLLASNELRQSLVLKGFQRLAELQKISITKVLEYIFDDYAVKLKCWKQPSTTLKKS